MSEFENKDTRDERRKKYDKIHRENDPFFKEREKFEDAFGVRINSHRKNIYNKDGEIIGVGSVDRYGLFNFEPNPADLFHAGGDMESDYHRSGDYYEI